MILLGGGDLALQISRSFDSTEGEQSTKSTLQLLVGEPMDLVACMYKSLWIGYKHVQIFRVLFVDGCQDLIAAKRRTTPSPACAILLNLSGPHMLDPISGNRTI